MKGLIGKKLGMTQVWDTDGRCIPVTVLELGPCPIVQVKSEARDGYSAVQIGFSPQKPQRLDKSAVTRFSKAGVEPCRILREVELDEGAAPEAGQVLDVGLFEGVKFVDIQGITRGRGFAGVMRRFGFSGGRMTHGGHAKRRPGSIGSRAGMVDKGKKLPGQMGAVKRTTQNLEVVQVRKDDNLLLVHGAVPGPVGGTVYVTKALKKKG